MKYENYTALDFVSNEDFQNWVKHPDENSVFYWESWMQNHKDKKHLVIEARDILYSINFPTEKAPQAVMDGVFENILKNERPVSLQIIEEQESKDTFNIRKKIAIAASLLLIAVFAFSLFDFTQDSHVSYKATFTNEIIKENPSGRKTTFQLADGSKIKLNASSTLRVADSFGIKKREVYLEGEAYFEISKNPSKPFVVHTGNISTLVTGTSFNVNAFDDKNTVDVAVLKGKVNTILNHDNGSDTMWLQESEMAIINKSTNRLSKTTFNYLETMGWKDGIIYFKDATSRVAFDYLERWYGVDFHVKDQDKLRGSFYGEFKDENLENVLRVMSNVLQFEYQLNDSNVFIKPIEK